MFRSQRAFAQRRIPIVGMKRWLVLRGIVETRIAPPLFTRSPSADGAHTGRPVPMEIIGLDLHKRESQLSIKADDGSITDRRIATSRERFTTVAEVTTRVENELPEAAQEPPPEFSA